MSQYRKKPVVIEATQWFKNGDHPGDNVWRPFEDTGLFPTEPREGAVVRYFRRPDVPGEKLCPRGCGRCMNDHGWIDVVGDRFSGFTVCPGDYVVTDAKGGVYPLKPAFFDGKYEAMPPTRAASLANEIARRVASTNKVDGCAEDEIRDVAAELIEQEFGR